MTKNEFALFALAMSTSRPFEMDEAASDHARTSTLLVTHLVREATRMGWLESDPKPEKTEP